MDDKKLGQAYDTLKDPAKRREYDFIWARITNKQWKGHEESEPRATETAAEAERKRAGAAAQEKASKAEEERRRRLQFLESKRKLYDAQVFEVNRNARKLAADIKRIQELDDEATKKEQARNSWWAYISSPIYGRVQESDEEKRQREAERLQRTASRRIKTVELVREEGNLRSLKDKLEVVNAEITVEKRRQEEEARQEAARKRAQFEKEEAARRQAEQERMHAEWRKMQKEAELARERWQKEEEVRQEKAREEQEARQRKEREEAEARLKKWREQAEERTRAAKEREVQMAQRARKMAEDRRKSRETKPDLFHRMRPGQSIPVSTATNESTPCQHNRFWPKIEGSQNCSNCRQYQNRFAFKCPDCGLIACANCRQSLRGETRGKHNGKGGSTRKNEFARSHGTDDTVDFDYWYE